MALKATSPAVEDIHENKTNAHNVCEAGGLYQSVNSLQFIFVLVILKDHLSYTKTLSDCLQKEDKDFVSAIETIDTVQRREMKVNSTPTTLYVGPGTRVEHQSRQLILLPQSEDVYLAIYNTTI